MAKANPKKWFPSKFTVQITLKKVDKWAVYGAKNGRPYFDTWEEAHAQAAAWADAALAQAKHDAEAAKRAIAAAQKRIKKVSALASPNAQSKPPAESGSA